jgi:hypothetical protein
MMYVAQFAIVLAVVWANIYFGFTENYYLAGAWALIAAIGFTLLVVRIGQWRRGEKPQKLPTRPFLPPKLHARLRRKKSP